MAKKIITGGGPQGDGVNIGSAATEKVGLYGATPIVQRAGAAQGAVAVTALTISDPPTQAEVQAVVVRLAAAVVLVNELRAALVALGAIKGAA